MDHPTEAGYTYVQRKLHANPRVTFEIAIEITFDPFLTKFF